MTYVTTDEFRTYLQVTRGADPGDDALLISALTAAEAGINDATGRKIALAGVSSARTFPSKRMDRLYIDDCTAVTAITDSSIAVTDYQLEPVGNRSVSGEYRPYSEIRRRGGWPDSDGWANVSVTATWGWATIPAQAVNACKILAKDILSNQSVNFGIAAFTEYAGIRARENPQVWERIAPLCLLTVIATGA